VFYAKQATTDAYLENTAGKEYVLCVVDLYMGRSYQSRLGKLQHLFLAEKVLLKQKTSMRMLFLIVVFLVVVVFLFVVINDDIDDDRW